jgi:hypothetical protein
MLLVPTPSAPHSWQHHASKDGLCLRQAMLDIRDGAPQMLPLRALLLGCCTGQGVEGVSIDSQPQGRALLEIQRDRIRQ